MAFTHPHKIFDIDSTASFNAKALEIFYYQAQNNPVYKQFLAHLGIEAARIQSIEQIPFLPISLFKTQRVICGNTSPELHFTSSGTTGQTLSNHWVANAEIYKASVLNGFASVFGNPAKYCILGLLPGYLQRKESSLVYMVNYLQELSGHALNGNFLNDFDELNKRLNELKKTDQPCLLFGVTYALLDFSERFNHADFTQLCVIETGGMKGKRKEMTRYELHNQLKQCFGNKPVFSEYGMTELLSQAWFTGETFYAPNWMKILVRDKTDPLLVKQVGSGGINVIDLANVESCSFIATGDAGRVFEDQSFLIEGRLDNEDIRGCNLLYEEF